MGEISERLANITILNAIDNRSERPEEILGDMEKGIKKTKGKYYKFVDRKKGIKFAINLTKRGDTVVICGKGHEKSMNFNGTEKLWSDLGAIRMSV